jgi:hypothetical protein
VSAQDGGEVEVTVYHYYTYFNGNTCDVIPTREDTYQYGTVGHHIQISLKEDLIEFGYDLDYINYRKS